MPCTRRTAITSACRPNGATPRRRFQQRKFFETLERCLEGLPKNTARVFMMREVMGLGDRRDL